MGKMVMNKNVIHNGKPYSKGSEISEDDGGFKALVEGGHAVDADSFIEKSAPGWEPTVKAPPKDEAVAESPSEDESEDQPQRGSKKSRR